MRKICKLIFIFSFLPYVALILISTYHSMTGYDITGWIHSSTVKTIYGIDAFVDSMTWNFLTLCFIPVIPVAMAYQIMYVLILMTNKVKRRRGANKTK